MKFLFWLLGLFALAVALTLAAHNPGYVLLVYPPWRVEMSLSLFVAGLLALFLLAHFALRLLSAALGLPAYVRRFRAERAHVKGRAAMMESLTAFFEGRYAAAEKSAAQAMELGEESAINPIIAARAAHELREFDRRDAYLAASEGKTVGDTTMRLMAATKFRLDQHQPQAALDTLKALRDSGVKGHTGALHLELKAQQQVKNWDAVLDIVEQLEKRRALDATAAGQLRQQAWLEKLRARESDAAALLAAWQSAPREIRLRGRIAAAAARAFTRLGDCENARQALTASLNAEWNSELAALYGDCPGNDAVTRIEQAERWLPEHSLDASLLLALGKLCLQQELWGKARTYLEASIGVSPGGEAYTALGRLEEKLHKPDAARNCFEQAARLSASGKNRD